MKKGIYVVKDSVANELVTDVFTCINDSVAIRGFAKFLENSKEINPKCFKLIKLGEVKKSDYDEDIYISSMDELGGDGQIKSSVVVATGSNCESKLAEIEDDLD